MAVPIVGTVWPRQTPTKQVPSVQERGWADLDCLARTSIMGISAVMAYAALLRAVGPGALTMWRSLASH
jgi:hypothetical protein